MLIVEFIDSTEAFRELTVEFRDLIVKSFDAA